MQKNEKALITGVIIGASVATAAIVCFVYKTIKTAELHLFKLDGQEEKEDQIDSLIPKYEESENNESEQNGKKAENPYAIPRTPSLHGKDCLTNGEHPGIECECDECPHYLECFPEWEETHEHTAE